MVGNLWRRYVFWNFIPCTLLILIGSCSEIDGEPLDDGAVWECEESRGWAADHHTGDPFVYFIPSIVKEKNNSRSRHCCLRLYFLHSYGPLEQNKIDMTMGMYNINILVKMHRTCVRCKANLPDKHSRSACTCSSFSFCSANAIF